MRFGSPESRRAEEFDAFRRELVMRSKTVSGEQRELWFERLKELIEAMFPESGAHFRKPGLATRMFSAEVPLPGSDKMHLLDLAQELDDNWKATYKEEIKAGASCVYVDRMDGIWEWALDLGTCFVTGHVKLRNFVFDKDGDKGGHRPFGDRKRAYGDDRPPPFEKRRRTYGDDTGPPARHRPPYGDRPNYGDRPHESRPPYDRPQDPSGEGPKPRKPYPSPSDRRKGPSFGPKSGPKFGPPKKSFGRPKRKP